MPRAFRVPSQLSHRAFYALLSLAFAWVAIGVEPVDAKSKKARAEAETSASPALDEALLGSMAWREVGPYRGGRSAAVAGIPSQTQTYYFGATGGGVWKTGDGGKTWDSVSDGFFGGSIGAVAVSEWDPNVVYVGEGEKTVRGNVSHGDGMWKSNDAGKTWTHIGLADSRHIPRIRIHPKNPDLVYVAALGHLFGPNEERGIYRSRDGGETWERIHFVNPHAGAVDLAMDPTNPRILYASFWRVLRTPWSLESGGEGSGLWKSTDGGDTWTELTGHEGMPDGPIGISGISVSASNPENLYAIIEAEDGGVFRSRDGGDTWTRTNDERKLRQRAWYYTRLEADPVDEETVYVLNVRFHRSKDGGKTFTAIPTPHGDNHDLWIAPDDPLRMVQANDGGANVSFDGGETWTAQDNQPTAQMYRVSTDNAFPYRLLGGQQDNSAIRIRSRSAFGSAIGVRDWEPTAGGESGHIVAKPDDPDIVFGGSYGGFLTYVNHRTGERRAVNVWPDNPMGWGAADLRYRFQWNFPILFSPHDPNRLYVAANHLFQSDDLGHSWQIISPDLTRNDKSKMGPSGGPITKDNTSVEYYGTIFAVAASHHEADVLWAGSDDGLLHITRDNGETWQDVTPPQLPEWAQINGIDIHPFAEGGLYVAATRYKLDDFEPYLFKTTDYGATWTRIDTGIDRQHFTRALRADPDRQGLLYAGTERGVYVSFDDGEHWQSLQLELPLSPVTDLAVKEKDLVVATQGRGYWILDDLTTLHQLDPALAEEPVHLFTPRDTHRLRGGRTGNPGNRGTNPPDGVVFHFWLGEEPVDPETQENLPVELEITDTSGERIRHFTRKPDGGGKDSRGGGRRGDDSRQLDVSQGMNRFVWNLHYPGAEDFPGMILWNSRLQGPRVTPGTYRARLTVGETTAETDFTVLPDPRSSASPEDYDAQLDFLLSVRDTLNETHRSIGRLRDARTQIEALEKRCERHLATLETDAEADSSDDGESGHPIEAAAAELREKLDNLEKNLYQTKNRSRQDPLNFPIRLNDKLAGLLRLADFGDFPPTEGMVAVRDELTGQIHAELETLEGLWAEDLQTLETLVREHGIPAIALEAVDP